MPEQNEVAVHTLFTREIRPIYNWHEWLARWQAAEDLQSMEGLLHVGFTVSLEQRQYNEKKYGWVDRYLFYFTIADGWADDYLLELPSDGDTTYAFGRDSHGNMTWKRRCELRQQLARKAFDLLCLNFFKTELEIHRDQSYGDWEEMIISEQLFPVIQNFFRIEKDRFSDGMRIRNLSRRDERSHNEQQAVSFLLSLAKFIWEEKEPRGYRHGSDEDKPNKHFIETRARVDTAKPWMIEVLAKLDRLGVLRRWVLELDKTCLAKLKEIALRSELSKYRHPVAKNRLAATLDEARYIGSKAAWFLAEHELMTKEHTRFSAIREAEYTKERADCKIKKLTEA